MGILDLNIKEKELEAIISQRVKKSIAYTKEYKRKRKKRLKKMRKYFFVLC